MPRDRDLPPSYDRPPPLPGAPPRGMPALSREDRPYNRVRSPAPTRAPLSNDALFAPRVRSLTDAQTAAVETNAPRLLINAGAGSGKTEVLARRFVRLSRDCRADEMVGMVFGTEAAAQFQHRVAEHSSARFPFLDTSHKIGYKILRESPGDADDGLTVASYHERTDRCKVIESRDIYRAIRQSIQHRGLTEALDAKAALTRINAWKNAGIDFRLVGDYEHAKFEKELKAAQDKGDRSEVQALYETYETTRASIPVYEDYEMALLSQNLIDFADMLLLPVIAMHNVDSIRRRWRNRFRHILVDEYQDINLVQYDFIRALLADDSTLTCVGDDFQGIFGWRGADIGNILAFTEDFPDAEVLKLEQNFRSTQPIITLSNKIIARVSAKLDKNVWSARTEGSRPVLRCFADDTAEARWIAGDIADRLNQGTPPEDHAILVRTNRMTRSLESALAHRTIPYTIVGKSFYQQDEVQDLVAYLELAHDPLNTEAFIRAVNTPRRGIGNQRRDDILKVAARERIPAHAAMRQVANNGGLGKKVGAEALAFAAQIDAWHAAVTEDRIPLNMLLERIIAESQYRKSMKSDVPEDTAEKTDNIDELLHACEGFRTMEDLRRQASRKPDNESDSHTVRIMTLHAAKGSEYETVYIAGFEAGKTPHARASDRGQAGFDEERRLAYVGVTRPKATLYLCQVSRRAGKDVGEPAGGPILGPMSLYVTELGAERDNLIEIQIDPSISGPAPTTTPPGDSPPSRPSPVIDAEFRELPNHDRVPAPTSSSNPW